MKTLFPGLVLGLALCCPQGRLFADGPLPPRAIQASKGTDTSKVIIYWNASASTGVYATAWYELYRNTTFDAGSAEKLNDVVTPITNYDDSTTDPGVLYYYWVRAHDAYAGLGDFSSNDSGYQALMPPQNVKATAGASTSRVAVTWSGAVEAFSYNVYRSAGPTPSTGSLVYHTDQLTFSDPLVAEDTTYWYQVQTVRGQYTSEWSTAQAGYLLGKPSGVNASKGTAVNQVAVNWNAVAGATGYEIWRNSLSASYAAQKIGDATSATFSDLTAQPGIIYYYWVKAKSASATSGLSGLDSGYVAIGAVSLEIWNLIVQPRNLPAGSHPAVLSFRMRNNGPAALATSNTAMKLDFYMGPTTNINQALAAGSVNQDVTLAAGTDDVVVVNSPGGVTLPAGPGNYYVFARAAPVWPNLMANASPEASSTMGVWTIRVTAGGTVHYWAANDYNGDGITDMAVNDNARAAWSIQTMDGRVLWEDGLFGGAGFVPTVGDYDGDRKADPALYHPASGLWQVMLSDSGYSTASAMLGITDGVAMPGDYDGDGKADPVVHQESTGIWMGLMSASGYAQASGQFGGPGYRPVAGDYNGDGLWDLALYREANGTWFIRSPRGEMLKWRHSWGSAGYLPVSGDFDGDGVWDLALYNQQMGHWLIQTMAGTVLEPVMNYWGGQGWISASGDLNGDGISEQIVYQIASGRWYVITMNGSIIVDNIWGSSAATPVQWP